MWLRGTWPKVEPHGSVVTMSSSALSALPKVRLHPDSMMKLGLQASPGYCSFIPSFHT